jgi:plastocyanin
MTSRHCDSFFHPHPKGPPRFYTAAVCAATILLATAAAASAAESAAGTPGASGAAARYFMPDAAASKILTVAKSRTAAASIVVLTEAVAVKETGPKATIAHFGEVYDFSPSFIAVHRDEAARITLWNLQPDDEHDFMIEDRSGHALMHLRMPPLSKTSYVYTFHREGLFDFRCAVHQPEMNGQILVLPPLAN